MASNGEIVMVQETDPLEISKALARFEQFERNVDWLEAHANEAYSHRGKFICIAGEELFVGETTEEVIAMSKAAHPDDDGRFTRYVPTEWGPRIYAHRWPLANV